MPASRADACRRAAPCGARPKRSGTSPVTALQLADFEARADRVLDRNRGQEWLFATLAALQFLTGLGLILAAIVSGDYGWSIPTVVTTYLLRWPLTRLWVIRQQNIAVSLAPALIRELPAAKAVEQIQRLIESLYPVEKV